MKLIFRSLVVAGLGGLLGIFVGVCAFLLPSSGIVAEFMSFFFPSQMEQYKETKEHMLLDTGKASVIEGKVVNFELKTIDDIRKANEDMFLPLQSLWRAYENTKILNNTLNKMSINQRDVSIVSYKLAEKERKAFAYGPITTGQNRKAVLIIPGQGDNQATAIYDRIKENRHYGILDYFNQDTDVYLFIRPNEDILAYKIKGRNNKLSHNFIITWQIAKGGSYDGSCIANSIAFVKALQKIYAHVGVVGLDAGADAAVLSGLQSQPDMIMSIDGYLFLSDYVDRGGMRNILIPGVNKHIGVSNLIGSRARILFANRSAQNKMYEKVRGEFTDEVRVCQKLKEKNLNITCLFYDQVLPASKEIALWMEQNFKG